MLFIVGCTKNNTQTNNDNSSLDSISQAETSDNHLACRTKSDNQIEYILKKIKNSDKQSGAILYFHGGLSSQNYMKDELGPMLLGSLFNQTDMNNYYPIFVNYDASLFQGENLLRLIERISKGVGFQRGLKKFKEKLLIDKIAINKLSDNDNKVFERELAKQSMSYLDPALSNTTSRKNFQYRTFNEKQNDYILILKNDEFAETVGNDLIQSDKDFEEIANDIKSEIVTQKDADSTKGLTSIKLGIGIVRALARFAVGNHHQIVPTFEEEIFRALEYYGISIKNIAADHWDTVKKHSKQCFGKGAPGFKLITKLLDYQKDNPGFTIHTISHSAGAIPTGELLKAISKKNQKINSVNLIVPAINQIDFNRLFIPHIDATEKLNSYILRKKEEKIDSIAWGAYPASLLYFVSGLADNAWYGDKMLLLEQHLHPTKRPYKDKQYLNYVKENPEPVWKFFKNNPESQYFYPGDLAYENSNYSKRASHECTKYPWISTEVGKSIIKQITGKAVDSIPIPLKPLDKVKKANENCI